MIDFDQQLWNEFDGEIDWEPINELIEEFLDSPEAAPYQETGVNWIGLVIEYALRYEVSSLGGITPEVMETVLFGLFPEKVVVDPKAGPEIVQEVRAFWTYLHRQYKLKTAPRILADLTPRAEERLRRELADSSNFGMGKSFFGAGQLAGYDMTDDEEAQEFINIYNAQRMGMPPSLDEDDDDEDDYEYYDDDDDEDEDTGPREINFGASPKDRAKERSKKRKNEKKKRKKK